MIFDFDEVNEQIKKFNTMSAEEQENFTIDLFDKIMIVHIRGYNVGYDDGEEIGFERGKRRGKR